MSAAIRCRHLHRQRGLPRLQGGSGAGRDSACCAGRLRPPPPWDRSDSAAAVLRGRRPRARWARSAAFPSGSAKARIWRILASILRMSWHQLKACIPHRPLRARYSDFGYLLVWGYIADLSMVPRLRRGRLAGRALRTPFISCAVKITHGPSAELGRGPPQAAWRGAVVHPSGGPSAPGRRCWRLGRKRPSPFSNSGPTPLRSDPNLEGLKSLRCCCAKGWGAAAALQSICVCAGRALLRGINAHTATAPQGARYTQLEVSHRPQAGGHRTPSP